MTVSQSVEIRGVTYDSIADAARAHDVSEGSVKQHAKRGTLDRVGLKRTDFSRRGKKTVVRGVTYDSLAQAARVIGVSLNTIYKANENGTLQNVGLGSGWCGIACEYDGKKYKSIRAAAADLGLTWENTKAIVTFCDA